jgi:hypothetical protein
VSRLLFPLATLLSAQQIQPDTQSLAARLKRIRAQDRGLAADQSSTIQKALLAWVDEPNLAFVEKDLIALVELLPQ